MPSKSSDIFDQPYVPIWCEGCDEQGYVFHKDIATGAFFVVCPHCGHETSEVNCDKCGVGGEFVENIKERPQSWTCSSCKTEYALPADFYEKPLTLYLGSDLPEEMRAKVGVKGMSASTWIQMVVPIIVMLAPIGVGSLVGLIVDGQVTITTGFPCFFSSLVGFIAISKTATLQSRVGIFCISLIPIACTIITPNTAPSWLSLGISYGLGVIYGLALTRFVPWYTSKFMSVNSA